MGDDELVEVNLSKGVGERIVRLEVTRRDLRKKSSKQILEEALNDLNLSDEDKRELSLIKTKVDSGRGPIVHALDMEGNRKLIPYEEIGLTHYAHEVAGKPMVSIDYGTKHEIGY